MKGVVIMGKAVLVGGLTLFGIGTGLLMFHAGSVWKLGRIIRFLDDKDITNKLLFGK